jgi:hypothetical protein
MMTRHGQAVASRTMRVSSEVSMDGSGRSMNREYIGWKRAARGMRSRRRRDAG